MLHYISFEMSRLLRGGPPLPDIKLAPSILAADFNRLGEDTEAAVAGGAEHIHVDVMDGHFVPNLSIGVPVVAALRQIVPERVLLDVHLMIEPPEPLISAFAEAGADALTVHVEATSDLQGLVEQIRESGARPGVALNPSTPISALEAVLPTVDLFVVMSVNPGYGGQSYIPASTPKITRLRQLLDAQHPEADISVDGGVKAANAGEIVAAGGNVLVSGTGVFNADASVADNMAQLRKRAMSDAPD